MRVDSVSGSMERRRTFEAMERCRRAVIDALHAGSSFDDVITLLVHQLSGIERDVVCAVLLLSEDRATIVRCIAPTLSDDYTDAMIGLPAAVESGSSGRAAFTGQRQVVTNLQSNVLWQPFQKFAESAGIRSCWSQPILLADGTCVGVLEFLLERSVEPSTIDLRLMEHGATLAAIAWETHFGDGSLVRALDHAAQTSTSHAEILRATQAIASSVTEPQVLARMAEAIQSAGWGSVVVCLFHAWDVLQMTCAGLTDEQIDYLRTHQPTAERRATMYSKAFARYRVGGSYFIPADQMRLRHDDLPVLPGEDKDHVGEEWRQSDIAYVPIIGSDGTVLGTISLDDPLNGRRPDLETFDAIESLAGLGAAVIERIRVAASLSDHDARLQSQLQVLDHRVRNTLGSLLTLVRSTQRMSDTTDELVAQVSDRIQTMMKIDAMLSAGNWLSVDIRRLIETVSPATRLGHIELSGPAVPVSMRQAGALGLVMHELMAASLTRGALSERHGQIHIVWTIVAPAAAGQPVSVRLNWHESCDGVPVIHDSVERLIAGLVRSELIGRLTLHRSTDPTIEHLIEMTLDPIYG